VTYDDWKLATPPEYEWGEPPIHEEEEVEDERPSATLRHIELDDRNDPPIL